MLGFCVYFRMIHDFCTFKSVLIKGDCKLLLTKLIPPLIMLLTQIERLKFCIYFRIIQVYSTFKSVSIKGDKEFLFDELYSKTEKNGVNDGDTR